MFLIFLYSYTYLLVNKKAQIFRAITFRYMVSSGI